MARTAKMNGNQRRSVASLAKQHGASRAAEILAAPNDTEDAKLRAKSLFPEPITVTIATVCRYAKEYGIALAKGRRPKQV
jgi:hypothetical protein